MKHNHVIGGFLFVGEGRHICMQHNNVFVGAVEISKEDCFISFGSAPLLFLHTIFNLAFWILASSSAFSSTS